MWQYIYFLLGEIFDMDFQDDFSIKKKKEKRRGRN